MLTSIKIKKILITLTSILLFSASSHADYANGIVLYCTTPGDALDGVFVIEGKNGQENFIDISYLDGSSQRYKLGRTLTNLKNGEADTLDAAKNYDLAFGGGIPNAILLRIFEGQKSGKLAANGNVYTLQCRK